MHKSNGWSTSQCSGQSSSFATESAELLQTISVREGTRLPAAGLHGARVVLRSADRTHTELSRLPVGGETAQGGTHYPNCVSLIAEKQSFTFSESGSDTHRINS